jgi:hypothetical protein
MESLNRDPGSLFSLSIYPTNLTQQKKMGEHSRFQLTGINPLD